MEQFNNNKYQNSKFHSQTKLQCYEKGLISINDFACIFFLYKG